MTFLVAMINCLTKAAQGFVLAPSLRGIIHHGGKAWWSEREAGVWSSCVYNQKADRDECWHSHSALSFLFSVGLWPMEWCHPHVPSSVKLLLQICPEVCLLGYSKFNQVASEE